MKIHSFYTCKLVNKIAPGNHYVVAIEIPGVDENKIVYKVFNKST